MNLKTDRDDKFEYRHLGSGREETGKMLETVEAGSLDELIDETIPSSIRNPASLNLPPALTEYEFLNSFRGKMAKNKRFRSFMGLGYYQCITPPVILRNIFENPGWYTAYTPYQAEIAQGRLEALINFQTLITDMTGMELANASLLDEGTAAAEAMSMLHALRKGSKKEAGTYFVDENIFPQTLEVLKTRAATAGIDIKTGSPGTADLTDKNLFGILIQYPDGNGNITDYSGLAEKAARHDVFMAFSADLLSLAIIKTPGEMGADVVTGSSQRFGIPMGYGGPHAAYFATREEFKRLIPGRIIGVSVDAHGKPAYRMALQTREQHIRREKATSNICTSQVLLAVMAGMYAIYHGPEGLINIANRIHNLTVFLSIQLDHIGYDQENRSYFDTLRIR